MTEWVNGMKENDGRRDAYEWLKYAGNSNSARKWHSKKRSKFKSRKALPEIKRVHFNTNSEKIRIVLRGLRQSTKENEQIQPKMNAGRIGIWYFKKCHRCWIEISYFGFCSTTRIENQKMKKYFAFLVVKIPIANFTPQISRPFQTFGAKLSISNSAPCGT